MYKIIIGFIIGGIIAVSSSEYNHIKKCESKNGIVIRGHCIKKESVIEL